MLGSLGHRVRSATLDFAAWAPSAGVLLLLASVLAVILSNSTWGAAFTASWSQPWGLTFGDSSFVLPVLHWINDGLLTIFFLVVGLEIKREFTVGHLASRRSAALPVAAAIGGMVAPALIYSLLIPTGPWSHGWGVPMATDTAFAVALMVMMGRRVPVELRIFLTAAAIVDDIGAILVVALFYSGELNPVYLGAAAAVVGMLALFIPTRPPPNLNALMTQANTIFAAEAEHEGEVLRHGPSLPTLRAIDAIHDRLESPADRMLRQVAPQSSYAVLPLFALANAGVAMSMSVLSGHEALMLAIICGLVVGKPLGLVLACVIAVKLGWAVKPNEYSWRQLAGAGALAGIGFTMSLFIAGQAFAAPSAFAAAKISVFAASVISAVAGVGILWNAVRPEVAVDLPADSTAVTRCR